MIHQYKQNGYNIVLDTYSGAIHIVDDPTYEAIQMLDEKKERSEIETQLKNKYDLKEEEIQGLFGEIDSLIESEQLFTEDPYEKLSLDVTKRPTFIKALCLNVAHTCNLTCDYCFASQGKYKGHRAIMSFDVGKRAIDFLLENSGSHHNLDIDFFGGEPLMDWEVVKQIVDYARSKEEEWNKHFRFTFTTNGVLLNDEIIDYLNENMDNVVLSLDGRREVHDRLRRTVNGKGSYDLIVPKFQELVRRRGDKEYYVRGTYTRENLDFTEDVKHMADLGFDRLSMEPVIADPKEPYALNEDHLEELYAQYEELANEMIRRREAGKPFIFYHYMLNLEEGPCIYKRISGCGAGTEYLAVTPTGELYPCHQFVGDKEWCIGNIYEGIKKPELSSVFKTCNCYSRPDCHDCWAKLYCSGGCSANAVHVTGDLQGVYDFSCKLFRKRIECAVMLKVDEAMKALDE